MDDVETLRMPQSGLWVQWSSSTRSWRIGKPDQLAEYDSNPIYDEGWTEWTGHPALSARGHQPAFPDDPHPPSTWWMLYGEHRYAPITVILQDGTQVPVQLLGGVWAAEWTSPPQRVVVRRGDTETPFPLDRPVHYLR